MQTFEGTVGKGRNLPTTVIRASKYLDRPATQARET